MALTARSESVMLLPLRVLSMFSLKDGEEEHGLGPLDLGLWLLALLG